MSESQSTRQLILDTSEKIFNDHCDKALLDQAEAGSFPDLLWQQLTENGFNQLGNSASGTSAADMYAFLGVCGRYAVPLPLAETLLVNTWMEPGTGIYSIGLLDEANGQITGVPWGRNAERVLGITPGQNEVVCVESPELVAQGVNMAGEARDVVALGSDYARITVTLDPYAQLAVTRANLMAGSLQALLELGIQFATERVQFGRAISKFQAIQHSLAVIAAEVAAACRAADAAVDAMGDERYLFEVAAAKARVGEAVTFSAEQVHQIHGAMGFTHEHRLHHFSRRAWAWRDEFGNEFYWQQVLGNHLAQVGADNVWSYIATRG